MTNRNNGFAVSGFLDKLVGRRAWVPNFIKPGQQIHLAQDRVSSVTYMTLPAVEVVNRCVSGQWDVPRFQRGFVWSPDMVRDLADSLWRDYPLGLLLLWRRASSSAPGEPLWIVDGQQRLTALCALFGKLPRWHTARSTRSSTNPLEKILIGVDTAAYEPPFLKILDSSAQTDRHRLIPLSEILDRVQPPDGSGLNQASPTHQTLSASQILARAWEIKNREIPFAIVTHELDDVLEIYERISGGGRRFRRLVLRLLAQATRARWHLR